jgi:hypothetical protein
MHAHCSGDGDHRSNGWAAFPYFNSVNLFGFNARLGGQRFAREFFGSSQSFQVGAKCFVVCFVTDVHVCEDLIYVKLSCVNFDGSLIFNQ